MIGGIPSYQKSFLHTATGLYQTQMLPLMCSTRAGRFRHAVGACRKTTSRRSSAI